MSEQSKDTCSAFMNALRILHSLDWHEAEFLTPNQWARFSLSPIDFLVRADDPTVDSIWAVIQARQPERYREAA